MNSSPYRKHNSKQNILVVDDDPSFAKYLCNVLDGEGYHCQEASNAGQARDCLSKAVYEVMLCDINMPGESGMDLMQHIISARNDIAVIMVTGLDDPDFYHAAINLGAYGYLIKPVLKSQLIISVESALRRLYLEKRLQTKILELKEANRKIEAQNKLLVKKERLTTLLEFAGAAAHELNNPLMGLLGNIDLLKNAQHQLNDYLDNIDQAGNRIADIVRKIQNVKEYKTKPYPGDTEIIDLHESSGE